MKTLIVGRRDVGRIVRSVGLDALMDEMIGRMTVALREFDESTTKARIRDGFHYQLPDVGLLEWMPVMHTGKDATIKVVGYHPSNPSRRNLPTILSTISLYDTASGHLVGLADGTFLTALRTGAVSAIASQILANPKSRILGLIGCGAQAVTQLHALLRCFDLRQVLIYDTDPAAVASFPERVAALLPTTVEVRSAPLDLLVQSADILCTATSIGIGEGPLFDDVETRPWLHVNAVGSDFAGKLELPRSLLQRSLVCPDQLEQAIKEGECQQVDLSEIGPSLVDLVGRADELVAVQGRITVFDSTGWAFEDQIAMQLLLHHADRLGLGLSLEIEDAGQDPLNPYELAAGDRVEGERTLGSESIQHGHPGEDAVVVAAGID